MSVLLEVSVAFKLPRVCRLNLVAFVASASLPLGSVTFKRIGGFANTQFDELLQVSANMRSALCRPLSLSD